MTVPIDYGMWGWTWDQNGNRTPVKGLINPFWIAVNMLLRTMGLFGDPSTGSTPGGGSGPSSSTQLATFVLPSLVVGDGNGAAEARRRLGAGRPRHRQRDAVPISGKCSIARSRFATGSPRCSIAAWDSVPGSSAK